MKHERCQLIALSISKLLPCKLTLSRKLSKPFFIWGGVKLSSAEGWLCTPSSTTLSAQAPPGLRAFHQAPCAPGICLGVMRQSPS